MRFARRLSAGGLKAFPCRGHLERAARASGFVVVAGVDEAGRGCLFGPVYAAAVVLSPERPIRGLRDSKLLNPERRQVLEERIRQRCIAWSVAWAEASEIDQINILQASRLAMKRAVCALSPPADYLLVDAVTVDVPIPQRPLIHGDQISQSIAAASILAKVHRDARMREWDAVYPHFGFARNKGYGTEEHLAALRIHGPTPEHRSTFEPVRNRGVVWH